MAETEYALCSTDVEMNDAAQKSITAEDEETFSEEDFPAYLVITGAAIACFCSVGYASSFGVLFPYYMQNQFSDIPKKDVVWIGSLLGFFMLLVGPIAGSLFDTHGPRVPMIGGAIGLVLSIMVLSFCTEFSQFILFQGFIGGGSCGLLFTPAISIPAHYFSRYKTQAIGITLAGTSLGAITVPAILDFLLLYLHLSFAWSLRILGVALAMLLTLACMIIKGRLPSKSRPPVFDIRDYTIATLLFGALLLSEGVYTPFSYIITYASENGIGSQQSSSLQYTLYLASLCGQLMVGALADRTNKYLTLIFTSFIMIIIVISWREAREHNMPVFAGIYGFTFGATISMIVAIIVEIAPKPSKIGTLIGVGMGLLGFGGFMGRSVNEPYVSRGEGAIWSAVTSINMILGVVYFIFSGINFASLEKKETSDPTNTESHGRGPIPEARSRSPRPSATACSDESRASPDESEASSEESEASPDESEVSPNESEASSDGIKASPDEIEASSYEEITRYLRELGNARVTAGSS